MQITESIASYNLNEEEEKKRNFTAIPGVAPGVKNKA